MYIVKWKLWKKFYRVFGMETMCRVWYDGRKS